MRVEYSRQATSDLLKIAADSRAFGAVVAEAVEVRIRDVIAYVVEHPAAASRVHGQPNLRVIPLIRYP